MYEIPETLPTIDTGIMNWHILIGEFVNMENQDKLLAYDEQNKTKVKVRKLTEHECGKLMGVKHEDIEKIGKNLSKSAQYHCFGDSIVSTVLMAIFGQMIDIDWQEKISETVEAIIKE